MKKQIAVFIIGLMAVLPVSAQKYMTKTGHVWFYSEAPLEKIEAHNNQVTSIIDTEKGDIVYMMLMKGFQFEKALMQEHFNEKYVESSKFPKSTFKGKIANFQDVNLKEEGTYQAKVEGDLTIHGVTKSVSTVGTIQVEGEQLKVKATFPVTVADYEIKIPGVVRDNIAKVVDVTVDVTYDPYSAN